MTIEDQGDSHRSAKHPWCYLFDVDTMQSHYESEFQRTLRGVPRRQRNCLHRGGRDHVAQKKNGPARYGDSVSADRAKKR